MKNSSRIVGSGGNLIYGVFNRPGVVLDGFKALMDEKKISLRRFSWIGSETAPEFDQYDHQVVVALSPTFTTLQRTFDLGAGWMFAGQKEFRRSSDLRSDPRHLKLLPETRFKPNTLEWVKINLGTNRGSEPIDLLYDRPGCALLWMAAEHPALIRAIDYKKYFGFMLGGLRCTVPGRKPFSNVPFVCLNQYDFKNLKHNIQQVNLGTWSVNGSDNCITVPDFQKYHLSSPLFPSS